MISVHETEKLSLQQIEKFLLAAMEVRFEASHREEVYGWGPVVMPAGVCAARVAGERSSWSREISNRLRRLWSADKFDRVNLEKHSDGSIG